MNGSQSTQTNESENESEKEKEEYKDGYLDDYDEPEPAMVRRLQQVLHLVVSVDHVLLGAVYVISQLLNLLVLRLNLFSEVLGFILSCLHNADHFVQLGILVLDHVLL